MQIALIGADFEENLGVAMIAAAAEDAGHQVEVITFNEASEVDRIAAEIIDRMPDVVGLSIQFQHRAHDFLGLAARLRHRGYSGHITCGGQFPTLAYRQLLGSRAPIDSVVLHEGEETFAALLSALQQRAPLDTVGGLALRTDEGGATRTECRGLPDLDGLPLARRYRPHARHLGVPFIPIMGSRGCWGACSYCSITSFYRDARAYAGGGKTLRHRSPDNVAAEMALLWHAAGGRGVFCFHDDNFLLPRPGATAERLGAIRGELDHLGVGHAAIIGKCRPDSMTHELAHELRRLGVIRLYVGVENVSVPGATHLNRGMQTQHVHEALDACAEAGIFGCYNLLLFEPDAQLDDVEENIRFIREHAGHPVNFCRAEPYIGTPMQLRLADDGALGGSFLGYDYRIRDDRTELLFRVCAAAFRQRNFAPDGVHNRYMGLGYYAQLLEAFHEHDPARRDAICGDADRLTRAIASETADLLEEALGLVRDVDLSDRERIERETALLGLRIAEADRYQHAQLDAVYAAMTDYAAGLRQPRTVTMPQKVLRVAQRLAQGVAVGALLTAWTAGLHACDSDRSTTVDPVPSDAGRTDGTVVDMVPQDGGVDGMVADPPPRDAGVDGMVVDMLPPDASLDIPIPDPLPPDASVQPLPDGMVVDMLPPDSGVKPLPDGMVVDMLPPDASSKLNLDGDRLIDQWRDTTPRQAERSRDLALFDPPVVRLAAVREAEGIRVRLLGGPTTISTRWDSDGAVQGDGREVLWTPESDTDQIRVGVRSHGGVAVVAMRASDVA